MAGTGDGVLIVVLVWGTTGVVRTDNVDLPADVERFVEAVSMMFLPN